VKLLCVQNAKTIKGEKRDYLTGILYLSPANIAGVGNVCPGSSKGCRRLCLYYAGRGRFSNVQKSRRYKTQWLHRDRAGFIEALKLDIAALIRKAKRQDMTPAIRLNGTSDLPWHTEAFGCIQQSFPDVQFYDYTKVSSRLREKLPRNYYLLLSRNEANEQVCRRFLTTKRVNVAVIFDVLPKTYLGRRVIDGDVDDLRFLDPRGVVVGLKAKGLARKLNSPAICRVAA